MKNDVRLFEMLLCVPLGVILMMMLMQVCLTTMKPLTSKLEDIKQQQEQQQDDLLDILGEDEYVFLIGQKIQ